MARLIPGQAKTGTASIEIRVGKKADTWDVYVKPSEERIAEATWIVEPDRVEPIKMITLSKNDARIRVYPVFTRPEADGTYTPKNKDIRVLSFDWNEPKSNPDENDLDHALDGQPSGMTRDPNFGLGIKKEYRFILDAVVEVADKAVLYIGNGVPLNDEFMLQRNLYEELVTAIDRIDSRAQTARNEVKSTTAYNMVAKTIGLEPRPIALGRSKIRQIIQDYASNPDFRDPDDQTELVTEIGRSARAFATRAPEAAEQLVNDVQLTRLEIAIAAYEAMMGKNLKENDWQKFFEKEPFLLSFVFGYPVTYVNGQSYVGGRRIDGAGEKIGDFLYKNSLSNDAAIVEIKRPQTQILKKYREGVFAAHSELSGGTAQVLDQRYMLTTRFAQHARDNKWIAENALEDYEIDCVLVIGLMPENDDEKRSFQLFRKNSHGVKIVTFDEVLQQLKQVHNFLKESKPSSTNHIEPNLGAIVKKRKTKTKPN